MSRSPFALALVIGAPLLACKAMSGNEEEAEAAKTQPAAAEAKETAPGRPGSRDEHATQAQLEQPVAVGAKAELDGLTVWVKEVRDCHYERKSSEAALKNRGQRLVGALVYFEGTAAGVQSRASASRWKAYDAEGITYNKQTPHGTDCTPHLPSAALAKGDKKKGWIAFKVPKITKQLTIKYEHQPPHRPGSPRPDKQLVPFRLL